MQTIRISLFIFYIFLCTTSVVCSQPACANDELNVVAILVAQTLFQVLFPSLQEEEKTYLQASFPAAFQSVAGGQHLLQPVINTASMQQVICDPVKALDVTLARVQSQIETGQLALQPVYSNTDIEALQQELHDIVPHILAAGISTFPESEQQGIKQVMLAKVDDFISFLRSKVVIPIPPS